MNSGATCFTEPADCPAAGTVSDVLARAFDDLGVRDAFGMLGGAIVPFAVALDRTRVRLVYARHETGAVFAAMEAHFATQRPSLVFTTSGPGFMNAINGIVAARWEGAKLIVVSGATPASQRGRWAFQETTTHRLGDLGASPTLFHFAATLDDDEQLPSVLWRIAEGLSRPGGFVAHLALPLDVQSRKSQAPRPSALFSLPPPRVDGEVVTSCAGLLSAAPFAIWLGFGSRHAAPLVRALVDRTGAPVLCTPRAKGIFPEDDPRFVGVTGLGSDPSVARRLARYAPRRTLVLGTRLGEFSSFWRADLVPPEGFIHVDADPDVHRASYPEARTVAVHAEVGAFLDHLLKRLPHAIWTPRVQPEPVKTAEPALRESGPVRAGALLHAVQEVIVDGSDALVLTEAGNAFVWCSRMLRFRSPGRFRVSTGYGSMGHSVAGVLGAALATGRLAVSIAGDGAMLMQSELSTAVQYGARAIWIVLNDGRYGMVAQGMQAQGFAPMGTSLPPTDFVLMARSLGAEGVHVLRESELRPALLRAVAAEVPFVVDVRVDPDDLAPLDGRIRNLVEQGAVALRSATQKENHDASHRN